METPQDPSINDNLASLKLQALQPNDQLPDFNWKEIQDLLDEMPALPEVAKMVAKTPRKRTRPTTCTGKTREALRNLLDSKPKKRRSNVGKPRKRTSSVTPLSSSTVATIPVSSLSNSTCHPEALQHCHSMMPEAPSNATATSQSIPVRISPPDHVQLPLDKYLGELFDKFYAPKLVSIYSDFAPLYVFYFRNLSLDLLHNAYLTRNESTPLEHVQLYIQILSSLGLQFP